MAHGICPWHDDTVTTVLIVDDHPSFRATARAVLEADGYEVVGEADTATSALEMARALKPDIVLLDVQLPDLDGFAACGELCSEGEGPDVVLVSSREAMDYGDLIPACGAKGFICKADLSGAALASFVE